MKPRNSQVDELCGIFVRSNVPSFRPYATIAASISSEPTTV
jgi:hypothetical protein